VIAHIAGVPVEEVLPSAAGASTALLLARAWMWAYFRRNDRRPDA